MNKNPHASKNYGNKIWNAKLKELSILTRLIRTSFLVEEDLESYLVEYAASMERYNKTKPTLKSQLNNSKNLKNGDARNKKTNSYFC